MIATYSSSNGSYAPIVLGFMFALKAGIFDALAALSINGLHDWTGHPKANFGRCWCALVNAFVNVSVGNFRNGADAAGHGVLDG